MQPHQEHFVTRFHEMGLDHKMRIQCICNYMEEAAGNHAEALGVGLSRLAENNMTWVLAKMRLILRRRPGAGESVMVETWPVKMERLQFRRDFIMYGPSREILAMAVTQWVIINFDTRRPERFPLYIAAMEPEDPPLVQENGDIRIPAVPGNARSGPSFPVRLADIDQNRHVNNERYIDFVLEAADVAGMSADLSQIDILFRAEGLRGDIIASRSAMEEGVQTSCIHTFYRQGHGQELARIRTVHR